MIADGANNRKRRVAVAGGVVLAHVLLVSLAMLRFDLSKDDTAEPETLLMMIDLASGQLQDQSAGDPELNQMVLLQELAPPIQDVSIELPEIEIPEVPEVTETASPATAAVTADATTGAGGDAALSAGPATGGSGLVLLQRVQPVYPATSVRRNEQGITSVRLHITASGRVDEVKVERSSGSKRLDNAAIEAFRKWRFAPLAGSPPEGKWLLTEQRFVLFQFTYSRLASGAAEGIQAAHQKPVQGEQKRATAESREALMRFIAQVRNGTLADAGTAARGGNATLRAALDAWGAIKSLRSSGMVGGGEWVQENVAPGSSRGGRETVEVTWSMFELEHEKGVSQWLVASDRDGEVWSAQAAQTVWK